MLLGLGSVMFLLTNQKLSWLVIEDFALVGTSGLDTDANLHDSLIRMGSHRSLSFVNFTQNHLRRWINVSQSNGIAQSNKLMAMTPTSLYL